MLVFEESVKLSEHSWQVHKRKLETRVEFGFQGDSDEEEKKAKRVYVPVQQRNFQHEDFEEIKDFRENIN